MYFHFIPLKFKGKLSVGVKRDMLVALQFAVMKTGDHPGGCDGTERHGPEQPATQDEWK